MRALVFFVTVVGIVGQIPVRAQVPDTQSAASDRDFSGIYAGAQTIIEPDVYPFTVEGERAHRDYDPLTGGTPGKSTTARRRACRRSSGPAL